MILITLFSGVFIKCLKNDCGSVILHVQGPGPEDSWASGLGPRDGSVNEKGAP